LPLCVDGGRSGREGGTAGGGSDGQGQSTKEQALALIRPE
jgi:hypothetical protein